MVKADAYGHGAVPIARALEGAGADGLCVATFDEAVELRNGGVRTPLLVLYPIPPALAADAARLGIAVAAGDGPVLAALVQAASTIDPDRPLALELEVETGLGRGGVTVADLPAAARLLVGSPGIRLAGLWTHFQAIEDAATTTAQVDRFEDAVAAVVAAGIDLPPRHASASAGLLGEGILALDGVRPGLAIYGIVPDELDPATIPAAISDGLRPVMSLLARPVRVADLPAGWGISYGPTFRTARPSRIATLPVGYGDGWSRRLSNRAAAIVRGELVPLVGNVAMDAVMADVTDVPGRPVDESDEFVLLGAAGRTSDQCRQRGARAHHQHVGSRYRHGSPVASGVPCRGGTGRSPHALRGVTDKVASIELWNGDICDLEVDAIVNAANLSLWMSTGVAGALKRAGGDAIEFAAVRQAPVPLGGAIVTPAGNLAAKAVIHAVSLDRERRTSGPVIEAAVRSAMARAREIGATSIAFPALGTGVGGFPLDEAARITVAAVRDELADSPAITHVVFALRGAGRLPGIQCGAPAHRADEFREPGVNLSYEAAEEQRDELVEQVAREIQLRGLTGPAVHFLEASRPYRALGRMRCCSSTRS